jgi:hypothetical protein
VHADAFIHTYTYRYGTTKLLSAESIPSHLCKEVSTKMHEMAVSQTREFTRRDAQLAHLLAIEESSIPIRFPSLVPIPRRYIGSSNNSAARHEHLQQVIPFPNGSTVATAGGENVVTGPVPAAAATTSLAQTTTTTATSTMITSSTQNAMVIVADGDEDQEVYVTPTEMLVRQDIFGPTRRMVEYMRADILRLQETIAASMPASSLILTSMSSNTEGREQLQQPPQPTRATEVVDVDPPIATRTDMTSGMALAGEIAGNQMQEAVHAVASSRLQQAQRHYLFGTLFTFDGAQGLYGNSHRAAAAQFLFNGLVRDAEPIN